jgi:pimeloyl-ACP methyl ester carboxylesterase
MSTAGTRFRWSEFRRIADLYLEGVEQLGPISHRSRELAESVRSGLPDSSRVRSLALATSWALWDLSRDVDSLSRDMNALSETVTRAGCAYRAMEDETSQRLHRLSPDAESRGGAWGNGSLDKHELQSVVRALDQGPESALWSALMPGFRHAPGLILLFGPLLGGPSWGNSRVTVSFQRAAQEMAEAMRRLKGRQAGGILTFGVGVGLERAGIRARQRPVEVKSSTPARARQRRLADGTASYLHEGLVIAKNHAKEHEPHGTSSIVVERLERPGRQPVFIVYMPGSANLGSFWSNNPNGLLGLGDALYGDSTAMKSGVAEALVAAGHTAGQPVVLAGHSQGGMHGANLAADPAFVERFSVRAVYTEGSPVGATQLDPRVHGLHVENLGDPVPALEGSDNPSNTQRVTITAPIEYPDALNDSVFDPREHRLEEYGRAAEFIDSGTGSIAEETATSRLTDLLSGDDAAGRQVMTSFEVGQRAAAAPPHKEWSWGTEQLVPLRATEAGRLAERVALSVAETVKRMTVIPGQGPQGG